MLKTQEYLISGKTLKDLKNEYGIDSIIDISGKLVKLNYCQIDSSKHKFHEIVRECRGLVLENISWKLVSCGFFRFYNLGEQPEVDQAFDWENATIDSKEDGSMIMLYCYSDKWFVNTKGSFGKGDISPLVPGLTWEQCFFSTINVDALEGLDKTNSYVFELMSPLNKVVVHHEKTHSKLLGIFDNLDSAREISDQNYLNTIAEILEVERPTRYSFSHLPSLLEYLALQPYSFEGLVVYDGNTRLKVKNPLYVAAHHLKNNGNISSKKNIIPFILKGEADEVKAIFPEYKEIIEKLEDSYKQAQAEVSELWDKFSKVEDQKEFALSVKHSKWCSVLFNARRFKEKPLTLLRNADTLLINNL